MARDKLHYAAVPDLKMKLISQRQTDGRLYNLPTTTEVVSLIVGDEHSADKRDIIIEKKSGLLKRIHELHPAYLPLQYPLLYPKGEDGYKLNIPHKDHANIDAAKRKQVTLCEYFCYRLQSRTNEAQTILHSRRLFQQWIIDGYCMIEPQKLNYVRQHQQQLRVDKYINLTGSNDHLETLGRDRGKRIILPSIRLTKKETIHLCLTKIENMLQANRRSLRDFPSMPYPIGYARNQHHNNLIHNEMAYDKEIIYYYLLICEYIITNEQKTIVDTIMSVVNTQSATVYFLYGYGGTGKTFVWIALSSGIRSNGGIVCTVASSGITSLLLPGGRTTHSKFAIPVPATENSTCNIHQGSELAELLKVTKLIVWDEAPMCHKFAFEALDKSLKDIMQNNLAFGGKIIVFGGDFRQILPIVPKGNRSDIVHATINASYNEELKQFAHWLPDIGDGKIGQYNDGFSEITIPDEFLIKNYDDPIHAIVEATYPSLLDNYSDTDYLQKRAFLASKKEIVDKINDYVLSLIPNNEKEYCIVDSIDKSDELLNPAFALLPPEFMYSLQTSGIPNHKLKLKVGTPIMLIRNLDQTDGLCNGTRLIITKLRSNVIEAEAITGPNSRNRTYIPRINMSPSESPWPFKLIRRQFPFIVSYAMTINKYQGQSLHHIGLYLPHPVFSHDQLYVALSRVKSKDGLHILIHDNDGNPKNITSNVVYNEVFANL
ncbi:ATP-dependent DNA helicase PIF1-like [Glycine soja]|uniref:ATP-dependent DNA helicase PIF1 n=1 Tax=Glycine max TaxID=3847 RepID=UPI000E21BB75|nr:ATP-dependent DNA helicase PIF1 [Glycine max]XP_028242245.1 ATP-dependent DNA helicase PIF1-like [Glycine soja]|eukprot:XP_025984904.1 ATP-dependent DNA helicase PIF1-like [Glycine max]